ncbi:acyl-CoA dehydrogenase [Pseudonocardiaceae bacterium YIM PH 21723]|nr:acyl-CoA dehydrogenase [Pseudonocardiaceae bacterium YIM PH 21723]
MRILPMYNPAFDTPLGTPIDLAGERVVYETSRLAAQVLVPQADTLTRVPRSHLTALGEAGAMGVPSGRIKHEVDELIAAACTATWFVYLQHHTVLRAVETRAPAALREQWEPGLRSGTTVASIAGGYLSRPQSPVRATRVDGGWRIDGVAPWVTGWETADLLMVSAVTDTDDAVFGLVSRLDALATEACELWTMVATDTRSVDFGGLVIPDDQVLQVVPRLTWLTGHNQSYSNTPPMLFGLLRAALDVLGGDSPLGARIAERGHELRTEAYHLLHEVAPDQQVPRRVRLRAETHQLVITAATACLAATGGKAILPSSRVGRLVRDAQFSLVIGQSGDLRDVVAEQLLSGL